MSHFLLDVTQYNSFTRGKDEIRVILQNFMNSCFYFSFSTFNVVYIVPKQLVMADKMYRFWVLFYLMLFHL